MNSIERYYFSKLFFEVSISTVDRNPGRETITKSLEVLQQGNTSASSASTRVTAEVSATAGVAASSQRVSAGSRVETGVGGGIKVDASNKIDSSGINPLYDSLNTLKHQLKTDEHPNLSTDNKFYNMEDWAHTEVEN